MVIALVPATIVSVIAGLAALIAFWAALQIYGVFVDYVLSKIPVVGDAIADSFRAWVGTINTVMYVATNLAVRPVALVIAAPPIVLTSIVDQAIALFTVIVMALRAVRSEVVGTAVGVTAEAIAAVTNPLKAQIDFITNVLIPNAEWFTRAVQAELWEAWHRHRGETYAADLALGASIEEAKATAAADLGWAIDGVRAEYRGEIADLEAGVDTRIGTLETGIDGQIRAVTDPMQREIDGIEGALAEAIPGIETRIRDIAGTATADAALATTAIATINEWIRTCGEPLCSTLGPELPFLRGINDMLTLGLLTAWVGDAIAEPDAAARRTDSMVVAPVAAAVSLFESMGARG